MTEETVSEVENIAAKLDYLKNVTNCIESHADNISETITMIKFELQLSARKRKILDLFDDAAEENAKDMQKSMKMADELSRTGSVDISDLTIDLRMPLHDRFIMCGNGGRHEGCGQCKEKLFATPELFHKHVARERKLKAEAIENGDEVYK